MAISTPTPSPYTILPATLADLADLARITVEAISPDPFWSTLKGSLTFQDQMDFFIENLRPRFLAAEELGAAQTWKLVDSDG